LGILSILLLEWQQKFTAFLASKAGGHEEYTAFLLAVLV
jgi:hypothetical protein